MKLADRLIARCLRRPPDVVIGGNERPYLRRWWLTPWRRWTEVAKRSDSRVVRLVGRLAELLPSVYLHQFLRSDDDRALHDHPWLFNCSALLRNAYLEHTIDRGGVHVRTLLLAGEWRFRWGPAPHRVELCAGPCWTLFITGPRIREWGFHCQEQGWIHWKQFTAADDPGAIGKGCEG